MTLLRTLQELHRRTDADSATNSAGRSNQRGPCRRAAWPTNATAPRSALRCRSVLCSRRSRCMAVVFDRLRAVAALAGTTGRAQCALPADHRRRRHLQRAAGRHSRAGAAPSGRAGARRSRLPWPSLEPPDPHAGSRHRRRHGAGTDASPRADIRHHRRRRRHAAAGRTRADDLSALRRRPKPIGGPPGSPCSRFARARPIRARI